MRDDQTSSPSESSNGRDRAEAVKARFEYDLLARPGVTGVATGPQLVAGRPTGAWAIRIYVDRTRDLAPDEALPHELDGITVDVIELSFVPHGGAAEPSEERRD